MMLSGTKTNVKQSNKYTKYVIKPIDKIDTILIINEWGNVLRILASLALKQTTQSQVVRKLSIYKKSSTLKALIEFDRIIMSDYILDYIDSQEICEIVQSSLCRGESYHQLTSAIAKISGGNVLNETNEIDLGINAESRCCGIISAISPPAILKWSGITVFLANRKRGTILPKVYDALSVVL